MLGDGASGLPSARYHVKTVIAVISSVALIFSQAACTTTQHLSVPSSEISSLPVGTQITVHLKDGTKRRTRFQDLTDRELVTSGGAYLRSEISKVTQARERGGAEAAAKSFGLLALVMMAGGVLVIRAIADGFGDDNDD